MGCLLAISGIIRGLFIFAGEVPPQHTDGNSEFEYLQCALRRSRKHAWKEWKAEQARGNKRFSAARSKPTARF